MKRIKVVSLGKFDVPVELFVRTQTTAGTLELVPSQVTKQDTMEALMTISTMK